MPDSYGKRQRDVVKARKAAAREDRRIARRQRHKNPGGVSTLEGDAEGAFSEAPEESEQSASEAESSGESQASSDLAGSGQESP